MNYLLNQIGITAVTILLATATCNNTSTPENTETSAPTEVSTVSESIPADSVSKPAAALDSVLIKTSMGDITIVLYNETPLHKANFLKHVNSNYYDGMSFHRVIMNFMIQGGDPNSKDSDPNNDGMGGPGYTIPAEFNPNIKHIKGAVAAARTENPEKASSGSQFYICHVATPFLDGAYTVFGQTVKGLDVVDQIATSPTGANDRPKKDIRILSTKHLNAPKAATAPKEDAKPKSKKSDKKTK